MVLIVTVVYHHVGYLALLKLVSRRDHKRIFPEGNTRKNNRFGILVCAFNEQEHIKEKLHNLGAMLYNTELYAIHVYLDGCTDNTYEEAMLAQSHLAQQNVVCHLHYNKQNQGKAHGINELITDRKSVV